MLKTVIVKDFSFNFIYMCSGGYFTILSINVRKVLSWRLKGRLDWKQIKTDKTDFPLHLQKQYRLYLPQ